MACVSDVTTLAQISITVPGSTIRAIDSAKSRLTLSGLANAG
jgi:hypothetical protein